MRIVMKQIIRQISYVFTSFILLQISAFAMDVVVGCKEIVSDGVIKQIANEMVNHSTGFGTADFTSFQPPAKYESINDYCKSPDYSTDGAGKYFCLSHDTAYLTNEASEVICKTAQAKGLCIADSMRKVSSQAIQDLRGRAIADLTPARRISLATSEKCLANLEKDILELSVSDRETSPIKLSMKLSQITRIEINNSLSILSTSKITKQVSSKLDSIFKARAKDYQCAGWRLLEDGNVLKERWQDMCDKKYDTFENVDAPGKLNALISELEAGQASNDELIRSVLRLENALPRNELEACFDPSMTSAKFVAIRGDWRKIVDNDLCTVLRLAGFTKQDLTEYEDWKFLSKIKEIEADPQQRITPKLGQSVIHYLFSEKQTDKREKSFGKAKQTATYAKINYQKELCEIKKLYEKQNELFDDKNFNDSHLFDGLIKYIGEFSALDCTVINREWIKTRPGEEY